jgi:hypothetical protein
LKPVDGAFNHERRTEFLQALARAMAGGGARELSSSWTTWVCATATRSRPWLAERQADIEVF